MQKDNKIRLYCYLMEQLQILPESKRLKRKIATYTPSVCPGKTGTI